MGIEVKNREQGIAVMAAGQNATTVTPGFSVTSVNKMLCMPTYATNGFDTGSGKPALWIDDAGVLHFEKSSGGGANNDAWIISYQLIEFTEASDIFISHFSATDWTSDGDRNFTGNLSPGLTDASNAVIIPDTGTDTSWDEWFVSPVIESETTVRWGLRTIRLSGNIASGQIVEFFDGSSVLTTTFTLSTSELSTNIFHPSTDPDATWVLIYSEPSDSLTPAADTYTFERISNYEGIISRNSFGDGNNDNHSEGIAYIVEGQNFSVATSYISVTGTNSSGSAAISKLVDRDISQIWVPAGGYHASTATTQAAGGIQSTLVALLDFNSSNSTMGAEFKAAKFADAAINAQVISWGLGGAGTTEQSPFGDELAPPRNFTPEIWNLCEMMSAVTARMGDRYDLDSSLVSFWVNQAYQQVANVADHDGLEVIKYASLLSSTHSRNLLLPKDYNEPIALSMISRTGTLDLHSAHTLDRISIDEYDNLDSSITGEPSKYAIQGRWIWLYPSLDSNYSLMLRMKEYPSTLTGCGVFPSVSPPWRWAIVLKSQELLEEYVGDDEAAARTRNSYLGYVSSLDDDLAKRQKEKTYTPSARVLGWGGSEKA